MEQICSTVLMVMLVRHALSMEFSSTSQPTPRINTSGRWSMR